MSYHNPYWQRVVQNQQKAQSKSQQQRQRRPEQPMDDFGHEWLGKDVEIERVKGQVVEEIRGRILDISKYWLKLFVNNQVLYLNKAFILSIKPAEIGGGASGGVNGDGKQRPG